MATFSACVRRLEDEDLPVGVASWCEPEYIDRYHRFFDILADTLEWFSRDDAPTVVSIPSCKRLLDLLYAIATANVTRLSISHARAKDIYMECPLTTIYLGIGACVIHLRENTIFTGRRDFFTFEQNQIDYCMRYRLDVKQRVPIERFTFDDVALSLLKLEKSMFALDYHPDLELYIDALDLRLCELLSYTNGDAMLSNPMYRAAIRDLPGQYSCSTSGEYYLIVSLLAIRKQLTGALCVLRADGVKRLPDREEDKKMIAHLQKVFLTKYLNVHSDDIDGQFADKYKDAMTFVSEVFQFLKLNGVDTRPDHAAIVTQFRNRTYWEDIANVSGGDIGIYLSEPDRNPVAFRVLFGQMAELLFQQQLQISWEQFCLSGEQIYKMNKLAYEEFVKDSHKRPYFVVCLNDACLFFRGQLYVFGKDSRHYFHALKEWLDIIASEFRCVIDESFSVRPLLEYLCNEADCLRVYSSEDTSNAYAHEDVYVSQKKQAQMQAYSTFKYILTGLNSEDHAADSENTIGDVEATGLENTAVSGWSFASSVSSSSSSSSSSAYSRY